MMVRYQDNPEVYGCTGRFNPSSTGEIIIHFPNGDTTSEYISVLDAFLGPTLGWCPMHQAFADKLIIPDNYFTSFRMPSSTEEQDMGWYYA